MFGKIPSELGLLSNLVALDLDMDKLYGSIPSQFYSLSSLRYLWLQGNALSGSLSTEISQLSYLQSLNVAKNAMSGSLPTEFGLLHQSLTAMDMGLNDFGGTLPTQLGYLTRLRIFASRRKPSHGDDSDPVWTTAKVTNLVLQSNELTGKIPLTDVEFLFLDNNRLSGMVPSEFGLLISLTNLPLDHNDLTGGLDLGICMDFVNLHDLVQFHADCAGAPP